MTSSDAFANPTDLHVAVEVPEDSPAQSLATLAPDSNVLRWYAPVASGNLQDILPAQEAYQSALRFCKRDLEKVKDSHLWLDSHNTIDSVLDAVNNAKSKHELTKSRSLGLLKKAANIWGGLSSRILHYQTVTDVLIQGAPDYVSLIWGAMKFLFVVTINHKELATKIAQALSTIGDILEPVHISQNLYPIPSIRLAVSRLYAQIIKFCIRATEWYQKRSLARLMSSVASPWPLEFGEIVRTIQEQSQIINLRAITASHAEIRVMHSSLQQHLTYQQHILRLHQTKRDAAPQHASGQLAVIVPPKLAARVNIELVLKCLPSANLHPEEDLRLCTVLRNRRKLRSSIDLSPLWLSETFKDWATSATSSVLHINSSILARDDARDFAMDVVKFAQSSDMSIVWAMNPTRTVQIPPISSMDIINSLLQQIIRQHSEILSNIQGLDEQSFLKDMSVQALMDIFQNIVTHVPRILIVLNFDEQMIAGAKDLEPFWAIFRNGQLTAGSIVKLLIVTHVPSNTRSPSLTISRKDYSTFKISLHKDRRDEERIIVNGRKAPQVQQRGKRTWEPEQLRPSLGEFFRR